MGLVAGQKLGAYEILEPIGAGGMGEVYRARDTRLDRDVAIKVLPERTAHDERALSRFARETKALAALSHPNNLMILDIGEHQGVNYAVMELLEGETLRQRLQSTGVDWRRATEIAAAIADGLAAAHSRDIVHRDLKPENLFLTRDGVVKILDFGLARTGLTTDPHAATMSAATQPGAIVGTVNYMSPEQVRGETVDARSDIFSLGCVLFEMLTGAPPFVRETSAETMTAILREQPIEISQSVLQAPVQADAIVARCLEKNPDDRFHSARDLAFSLRAMLSRSQPTAELVRPRRNRGARVAAVVAIVMVICAAGWAIGWGLHAGSIASSARLQTIGSAGLDTLDQNAVLDGTDTHAAVPRLAVLPFEDLSSERQDWFANGITDAVNFDLAQISGLWVAAHPSVRKYKDAEEPIAKVGAELGVSHVVLGSVAREGDRVQVRVQILEADTERHIWSQRFERSQSDYLGIQNEVARAIASAVRVTLTPEDEARFAAPSSTDPRAFENYIIGMSFVRQGTKEALQTALNHFDDALARDPDFALGYAGRAAAYNELSSEYVAPREAMPRVKEAAEKAIALDANCAEAYTELGYYYLTYEYNWDAARSAFEKAIELDSDLSQARIGYAEFLAAMDRGEEAMQQLNIVEQQDPKYRLLDVNYGYVPFMARHYDRVVRDARWALAIDPQWGAAHCWLGLAYSQKGEHDKAVEHMRKYVQLVDGPGQRAMAGGVYAVAGLREEARQIYAELKEEEVEQYVCPYELASIPIGLGEYDTAFHEMDRACEARADCLAWLQVDPRVDPIRDDPRFDELLIRVGFEPTGQGEAPTNPIH